MMTVLVLVEVSPFWSVATKSVRVSSRRPDDRLDPRAIEIGRNRIGAGGDRDGLCAVVVEGVGQVASARGNGETGAVGGAGGGHHIMGCSTGAAGLSDCCAAAAEKRSQLKKMDIVEHENWKKSARILDAGRRLEIMRIGCDVPHGCWVRRDWLSKGLSPAMWIRCSEVRKGKAG
jgi:hypothetical protein